MPISDKAESRVSPMLFVGQVLITVQLKTCKLKICSFQKEHHKQKGGCPDTLDTPLGSAPATTMYQN